LFEKAPSGHNDEELQDHASQDNKNSVLELLEMEANCETDDLWGEDDIHVFCTYSAEESDGHHDTLSFDLAIEVLQI
jgi:hypothetical protein